MKISESIIISIDISENGDTPVLAVCRKQRGNITEIVNIFQGEEAIDLYTKLITTKEYSVSTKHRNDGDEVTVLLWPDTKGTAYKDYLVNEEV